MIPIYIMEEHCEAYYYWYKAIFDKKLAPEGNLLLHVDHHDDLAMGKYLFDVNRRPESSEEALEIVHKYLGIADFITPALWNGVFNEMINFRSIFTKLEKEETKNVVMTSPNFLELKEVNPFLDSSLADNEKKEYIYRELSLTPIKKIEKPVVLDIDLDYFCWDDAMTQCRPKEIEITRDAYEDFNADPYHPWRILARRIVFSKETDGRYYLYLYEPMKEPKITRDERIHQRVDKFFAWLKDNSIQPQIIDICRSRISGYCPADKVMLIEELVLKGLRDLYDVEIVCKP